MNIKGIDFIHSQYRLVYIGLHFIAIYITSQLMVYFLWNFFKKRKEMVSRVHGAFGTLFAGILISLILIMGERYFSIENYYHQKIIYCSLSASFLAFVLIIEILL
ncbi:MAG: hypothetical protein ACTSRP_24270 [Candidatus Helarchaeota archaeon]